jgi:hypothetical protein
MVVPYGRRRGTNTPKSTVLDVTYASSFVGFPAYRGKGEIRTLPKTWLLVAVLRVAKRRIP